MQTYKPKLLFQFTLLKSFKSPISPITGPHTRFYFILSSSITGLIPPFFHRQIHSKNTLPPVIICSLSISTTHYNLALSYQDSIETSLTKSLGFP